MAFAMTGNRVEKTLRKAGLRKFIGDQWFFPTVEVLWPTPRFSGGISRGEIEKNPPGLGGFKFSSYPLVI